MKNKLLMLISTIIITLIFSLNIYAINVTFKSQNSSGTYLAPSTLEIVRGTGTTKETYTLSNGNNYLSMTSGTTFGFNMVSSGYAKRYSSETMFTVPSSSPAEYGIILTPTSTYSILNYVRPLSTLNMTSSFGWRVYLHEGSYTRNMHRGIDYSGTLGQTSIYSVSDASSYTTFWDDDSGNVIKITTGSYDISYKHLNSYSNNVINHQSIYKGNEIGKVGNTGSSSTNPHLHIEFYAAGTYRDPSAFYN